MALLSLLNGTLPCDPSLVIRHCPSKWCHPSLLIRCPHAPLSPLPSCHSAGRSVTRGGRARAGRGGAPGGRGESPGAGPWPSRPLLAILAILAFTMARRSLAITCPSPVAPLPDKERQPFLSPLASSGQTSAPRCALPRPYFPRSPALDRKQHANIAKDRIETFRLKFAGSSAAEIELHLSLRISAQVYVHNLDHSRQRRAPPSP